MKHRQQCNKLLLLRQLVCHNADLVITCYELTPVEYSFFYSFKLLWFPPPGLQQTETMRAGTVIESRRKGKFCRCKFTTRQNKKKIK